MTHLLVTNDFPPKVGGIQSYLYELWRRLPPDDFAVLTIAHEGAQAFDDAQPFRVERLNVPVLLPTPHLRRSIDALARTIGASLVVLDPALPIGLVGRSLTLPYAVVLHGAEITVPARLPGTAHLIERVVSGASLVVSAGSYAAGEARRVARTSMPETVIVPPGVDTERFRPLSAEERSEVRARIGVSDSARLVVSVSRLVPRKGMDVLIEASAKLAATRPDLVVLIGGSGRDTSRLQRLIAKTGAPVRLVGRIPDDELPGIVGAADVAVMLCRDRWLGLEQEGFGIVFLEAASCGVVQLAGRSGGADEAVVDGVTGLIADRPGDEVVARTLLARLLDEADLRASLGYAARQRAVESYSYDHLAKNLAAALRAAGG